uniref:Uncharacterized protein n=1 Tax=Anguilla anguilla TaxID=7936 RepID=A0A0E9RXN7_ANGAN
MVSQHVSHHGQPASQLLNYIQKNSKRSSTINVVKQ